MHVMSSELDAFIEEWEDTPEKNREVFLYFKEHLSNTEGVALKFIPRPGVTYSLRAVHAAQRKRGLFVMVDVVEDDPRWLSVCFYGDLVSDPEGRGDAVPGGLLGEDALCFDVEAWDESLVQYIVSRLDEACQRALALEE